MTWFYYMVCYDCAKAHPSKYRYCPQCGAKLYRWLGFYIRKVIDNAPTLGVVPVRRGEWVQFESETGWGDAFECSVCGQRDAYMFNYCPNCGAKMEDKNESEN